MSAGPDAARRSPRARRLFRRVGTVRCLAAVATLVVAACDTQPALPPSEPVPEPTAGLRPPERRGVVPEDARIADYDIEARLDAEQHRIEGKLTLRWRNRTTRTVTQLPFHLYMNAFRADDTAWMREARGEHRGQERESDGWGWIDVKSVALAGVSDVTNLETGTGAPTPLSFREDTDPTLMHVELPEPIGPGRAATVEIEFTTQLPIVFARTGYHEDFHMAGQWFPKIGVLEEDGGWQAHVFGLNDEFYADFGDYRVVLDVPKAFVVGASGVLLSETQVDGDRKRLEFFAEMVHDFAWVADPDFLVHWGEHDGIRIRQLIQPEHAADAPKHLEAQKAALRSMESRFGAYPWSTITIVHAPEGAEGAGGMEYPTFYTTSDIETASIPPWIIEERVSGLFTTIHEFGHQYFQGLFASNEHAQPWLDEGMNTTSNALVYIDEDGEHAWIARVFGHEIGVQDMMRLSMSGAGVLDPVDQPADHYPDVVGSYALAVYQKTAATMLTLRNVVGDEAFRNAMKTYSERARFRHPRGEWLERAFVDTLGERVRLDVPASAEAGDGAGAAGTPDAAPVYLDVRSFFDQALRETTKVDFAATQVLVRPQVTEGGFHRDAAGVLVETALPDWVEEPISKIPAEHLESVVVVTRRGEMRIPVEVLVEFEGDERQLVIWDGESRYATWVFPGKKATCVTVDPSRKLVLEGQRLDNVRWSASARPSSDGLSPMIATLAEGLDLALLGGFAP